uniref:Uncharacterized protein n=1 Tax=Graphocephala atropunctata TaxID=36148 RepID=A0A1B6KMQ5_9HEMI
MLFLWTETEPSLWQKFKCYFRMCEPASEKPTLTTYVHDAMAAVASNYWLAIVLGVVLVVLPASIAYFKPLLMSIFQRQTEQPAEEPADKNEPNTSVGDADNTRQEVSPKRMRGRPIGVPVYPSEVYQGLGASGCGLDHQGDFENDEENTVE